MKSSTSGPITPNNMSLSSPTRPISRSTEIGSEDCCSSPKVSTPATTTCRTRRSASSTYERTSWLRAFMRAPTSGTRGSSASSRRADSRSSPCLCSRRPNWTLAKTSTRYWQPRSGVPVVSSKQLQAESYIGARVTDGRSRQSATSRPQRRGSGRYGEEICCVALEQDRQVGHGRNLPARNWLGARLILRNDQGVGARAHYERRSGSCPGSHRPPRSR